MVIYISLKMEVAYVISTFVEVRQRYLIFVLDLEKVAYFFTDHKIGFAPKNTHAWC